MTTVRFSRQFIPTEELPQFEGSTPFREVYSRLSNLNASGFILIEEGIPRCYVPGYELAKSWLERYAERPVTIEKAVDMPIGRVVNHAPLSMPEVSDEPVWEGTNVEALPEPQEKIFTVQSSGLQIGWYLGKLALLDTSTGKTVWVCERGHKNPDPDKGTCYRCPFPIVRIELES